MSRSPRERYYNDNNFKTLVDFMVNSIMTCHYTPSEMRDAALLASIKYEEQHPPKTIMYNRAVLAWLDGEEDKG